MSVILKFARNFHPLVIITIFFITAFISFAGSIHIGPVNLMVIRTSLQKDYKSALLVGLGGSLPEILYAMLAVTGLTFLKQHPEILSMLNRLVVPFFFILGLSYFLPKQKKEKPGKNPGKKSFTSGLKLALYNPQLLPFWFATLVYLHEFLPFENTTQQVAFVIGTSAGAFALLSLYAWLANYKKELINSLLVNVNFDFLMGITFLVMGVIKIIF